MDTKPPRSNGKRPGTKRTGKNIGFIALIALLVLIIISAFNQPSSLKEIPISQAVQDANAGKYSQIIVNGQELTITPKGSQNATLKSYMEQGATTQDEGINKDKVKITAHSQ